MAEEPIKPISPRKQIKGIINRSGLLSIDEIARMFCLKKDTFLRKWNEGCPIIRELELRTTGKSYVADESHVWKILERYKKSLPLAVPKWRELLQESSV